MEDSLRENIVGVLSLFASFEKQRAYQRKVPYVGVPTELFCGWADDLYQPDQPGIQRAFGPEELAALAEFDEVFQRASSSFSQEMSSLEQYIASPMATELSEAAAATLRRLCCNVQ